MSETKIETFTKNMGFNEYNITNVASHYNIAPKILKVATKSQNEFIVTMEKYETTLIDYAYRNELNETTLKFIIDKVNTLIDNLHKLNVVHGDLHAGNILLNIKTQDIKLIDFGMSFYNLNIDKYQLEALNKSFDTEFKNINEYKLFEKFQYLWDLESNVNDNTIIKDTIKKYL